MSKYTQIFSALQEKVDNGELSVDEASYLNSVAYDKYATEESDDIMEDADLFHEAVTYLDDLYEHVSDL